MSNRQGVVYDANGQVVLTPGQLVLNGSTYDVAAANVANTASATANVALATANAALPKAGGTMTGDINMSGTQKVTNMAVPTAPGDATTKLYVDNLVTGVLRFKGSTDCSGNPNYPAAALGDAYVVSVAGKIGGAAGIVVEAGDVFFAIAANPGGTQAAVGSSWDVVQYNLTGVLLSANNLSDVQSAATSRTNLGLGSAATQNSSAFATAAQGTLASTAVQRAGDTMTGALNVQTAGDTNTLVMAPATGHVMVGTSTDITVTGGAKFQVRETGSSTANWRGRIVAGGQNYVFLMGEYNSQAWLGAHNSALTAWADLYINAGSGKVAIGGNGTVPTNLLEVNGTFKATGASTLGGSVTMSADFSATSGRTRGTATGANWSGRIVAGGPTAAFLMGQFNDQAWLGAHNDALTAWANLYINPQQNAGTSVYIGNTTTAANTPIVTVNNTTSKVAIGYGGTELGKIVVYTPTLTPAAVGSGGFSTQTFTVTGLTTGDTVIVNGPAATANSALVSFRVSAADTLSLTWFCQSALTPASGTYRIVAIRS